jgi:hypothetical protein
MKLHRGRITLISFFLLSSSLAAAPQPIVSEFVVSTDEVRLRAVVLLLGVDEALVRAGKRQENGRPGYEYGARDGCLQAVFANPCLPEGSIQYAKYAMAHIVAMQQFILRNPFMRREYLRYFAKFYHSSGNEQTDLQYAATLQSLWYEERNSLTARKAYGGYSPLLYAPAHLPPEPPLPKYGTVKP